MKCQEYEIDNVNQGKDYGPVPACGTYQAQKRRSGCTKRVKAAARRSSRVTGAAWLCCLLSRAESNTVESADAKVKGGK